MPSRLLTTLGLSGLIWLASACAYAATEAISNPPIQVGGSSDGGHDSSVTDIEIGIKLIFNEMLANSDESFEIKLYDSNDQVIKDFNTGKLQALFVSSLTFLEMEDMIHPSGRYVVQFGPTLKQRYMLLVRVEHQDINLSELRGKKLCVATGHALGRQFLDVALLKQGLPVSDDFFSEIRIVEEVNTAVVDLFFGKADAALVPEFSFELARELNPQISSSIAALATSEPMVNMVVGMRRDFPQQRLDKIEPLLLDISYSARLKRLLKTLRITGFYHLDEDTLEEVKALNNSYRTLTRQQP